MRTLGLFASYVVCFLGVRLIFLSVVAFTLIQVPERVGSNMLQKIGDVFRANEVLTYGAAALIFVVLLHSFHPLTKTRLKDVFDMPALRKHFSSNALHALILTLVFIFGTMLGGYMGYLGVYLTFSEVLASVFSTLLFGTSLFILAVVEEFLFRRALEPKLTENASPIMTMAVSSAVYLAVKALQFDMPFLGFLNFFLLNIKLSTIALHEKSPMASASFLGVFFFIAHVFFGLPFMGQDMPGLFLLRGTSDEGMGSLLSGGQNGPECGLVFTVLLIIYLYLPQIRQHKSRA